MLVFPRLATHVPVCVSVLLAWPGTARLRGIPGAHSALAQVTYFSAFGLWALRQATGKPARLGQASPARGN